MIRLVAAAANERADLVLHRALRDHGVPISRRSARSLLESRAARVDDIGVVRSSRRLSGRIVFLIARSEAELCDEAQARRGARWEPTTGDVLLCDDALVVVAKPSGLPTDPGVDPLRDSVVGAVTRWCEANGHHLPEGLRSAHRLDRDTSGVLVLARSTTAAAGLGAAFTAGQVDKRYVALTVAPEQPMPGRWTEGRAIGRAKREGRGEDHYGVVRSGGRAARTEFSVRSTFEEALLVEARPRTGRTHQIRAHLAASGLPIVGDAHYGGPTTLADQCVERVMLHAEALEFEHPVDSSALRFERPMPIDFEQLVAHLTPTVSTP